MLKQARLLWINQANLRGQVGAAGDDRLRLRGNIGSRAADLLFTLATFLITG